MRPFDLNEYKKNTSLKLVTRLGESARIVYDNCEGDYPLLAVIDNRKPEKYTLEGRFLNSGKDSSFDLFFEDETTKEGWVNVYMAPGVGRITGNTVFDNKDEAEKYAAKEDYIATAKLVWWE